MSYSLKGLLKRPVHTFVKPPVVKGIYPARGQLYYVKGSNGSGKSTVPSQLAERDPRAYVVTHNGKIMLTVCPSFNVICVGKYDKSNSKGVDTLKDTEQMLFALSIADLPEFQVYDVIFEGIIPSTLLSSWIPRLTRPPRELVVLFMDTPLETCIARVKSRNGGADFNESLVVEKWERVQDHRQRHKGLFPTVAAGMMKSHGLTVDQAVMAFLCRDFGSID
jgi:cytidylate kinase